jgi:hypothetical protein
MKIFKELKKLGYIHYSATTIEELDDLPLNSAERVSEQALVLRWFRKKHGMVFNLIGSGPYYPSIAFVNMDGDSEIELLECEKYEEAEITCLKKLIKIVKQKQNA